MKSLKKGGKKMEKEKNLLGSVEISTGTSSTDTATQNVPVEFEESKEAKEAGETFWKKVLASKHDDNQNKQ